MVDNVVRARLVPVAAPISGVMSVGVFARTTSPVPVVPVGVYTVLLEATKTCPAAGAVLVPVPPFATGSVAVQTGSAAPAATSKYPDVPAARKDGAAAPLPISNVPSAPAATQE